MFTLGIHLGILIGVLICYIVVLDIELYDHTDDEKQLKILKSNIEMQREMFYQQQKQDEPKPEACLNSLDKIRKD